ncbi:MAG: element excision factor XisI family protein [Saprospiraceae bacterium]|nr:element excision factor XisI family protein [Saprospiraceae bacterium]
MTNDPLFVPKDRHVHYTVFHFEIKGNKVWVHENRTDVNIEGELVDAGISLKDILSGLDHPTLTAMPQAVAA